jgi:hypothetical protein
MYCGAGCLDFALPPTKRFGVFVVPANEGFDRLAQLVFRFGSALHWILRHGNPERPARLPAFED